jgi:hypothetical protein
MHGDGRVWRPRGLVLLLLPWDANRPKRLRCPPGLAKSVAVPSRIFVGLTVFGLITSLALIAFTALVLSDYQPAPDAPYQVIFPEEEQSAAGTKVFLILATLFCIAFTVLCWRALLAGARHDGAVRRGERKKTTVTDRPARPPPGPPPGYQ